MLLERITWCVRQGERWALLGANGAGKSMLLSLAAAVRHPSSGRVVVLGEQLGRADMRSLRARIGVVDAAQRMPERLPLRHYVLTGVTGTIQPAVRRYTAAEQQRAEDLCDLLGLSAVWDSIIGTCSAGERSRARIARAMMPAPQLLLLDEPAAALDLVAREALLAALDELVAAEPTLTTVLVTHHLEELPAGITSALLLKAGRVLAAGPATDVLTTAGLSDCYGVALEVQRSNGRYSAAARRSGVRS